MSNPPPPQFSPNETLNEGAAFTARRKTGNEGTIFASGDFLYRIFPTPQRVFFIKIGGGTNQGVAFAFGVLGVLIHNMLTKDKAKEEARARVASFQGQKPALLLSQDKANHVLQRQEITKPVVEGPSFLGGGKFGKWIFRDGRKKKRTFLFEDSASFVAGVKALKAVFGEELTVKAQFDPTKNKIVKIKK